MNLIELIKNLLFSGGHLSQLSSLIGAGEGATKSAVGAAVPALLSGLSNLASSGGGAQKLLSALGKFDAGSLDTMASMLAENPNAVQEQGGGLLNSLLGGGLVAGIANAVAKFSGIGAGSVQKLLGYLMPVILGMIGSKFAGKVLNPQGLMSLFSEQKTNIANALPSGFSLADVPGLGAATSAVKSAAGGVQDAGSSLMKWLVPLLGLLAVALVAYLLWPKSAPPVQVPDVTQVSKDLTGTFSSLTDTVTGIKDAASATAALPKLTELSGKLDGMKALVDQLPEAGRAKITELLKSSLGKVGDQLTNALMIPGVGATLRPALEGVVGKLTSLGGLTAAQFALPSREVTQLGSDLTGMFSSLTETLTGIKDAASVDAALPKLKDLDGKLDATKGAWDKLPEAGKATLSSLVQSALAKLRDLVTRVLAIAGVGDRVKPVVDGIMGKLAALGG